MTTDDANPMNNHVGFIQSCNYVHSPIEIVIADESNIFDSAAQSSADGVNSEEFTSKINKPSPKATTSEAAPKPIASSDFTATVITGVVTAFVCGFLLELLLPSLELAVGK